MTKTLLLVCLSFVVTSSLNAADRVTGETFASRSPVLATEAMAATSQPLATQAALDRTHW